MDLPDQLSHGVLLSYSNIGVLVTGESGIGKSDSALELIERGAKLVCDDAPCYRLNNNQLIGSCPSQFSGVMHIRGLGLIHIPSLFGPHSLQAQSRLNLIIDLCAKPQHDSQCTPQSNAQHNAQSDAQSINQITMVEYSQLTYQNISIPILSLEKSPYRPMGLILSTAIKQFKLRLANKDPCQKLIHSDL